MLGRQASDYSLKAVVYQDIAGHQEDSTPRLYQILFSKQLNRNQWRAILLITGGCMCKESGKVTTLGFQAHMGTKEFLHNLRRM